MKSKIKILSITKQLYINIKCIASKQKLLRHRDKKYSNRDKMLGKIGIIC